jgi:hypothetical protein
MRTVNVMRVFGAHPTTRRRRKVVAILLLVLLVLVAADRIAAVAASGAAVQRVVQSDEGLRQKPTVSFGGFPFLTQVAFGKYSDIKIGIDDITPPGGPRIEHLSAHLKGAHIPFSKAFGNNVMIIPVDHIVAKASIGFADLNAFLKTQPGGLVLSRGSGGNGGAVQVAGSIDQDGVTIAIAGSATLHADQGQLTLTPQDIHVTGTGFDDIINQLGGLLSLFPPIPVPLPNLPFNLRVTGVSANADGVAVSASVDHVVLTASS